MAGFLAGILASKLNRNSQPACVPPSTAHPEGSFHQGVLIRSAHNSWPGVCFEVLCAPMQLCGYRALESLLHRIASMLHPKAALQEFTSCMSFLTQHMLDPADEGSGPSCCLSW